MPEEAQGAPQEEKKAKSKGKKKDEALDLLGAAGEPEAPKSEPASRDAEPSPPAESVTDASQGATSDPKPEDTASDSPPPAPPAIAATAEQEPEVSGTDASEDAGHIEPSIEDKLAAMKADQFEREIQGLLQFVSQRLNDHMMVARVNGYNTISVSLGHIMAAASNASRNIGDTAYWLPKAKR